MISLQIQIFVLLGIGFTLAKKGMFSKTTQNLMTNIVFLVILPATIIKSFQMDLDSSAMVNSFIIMLISWESSFSISWQTRPSTTALTRTKKYAPDTRQWLPMPDSWGCPSSMACLATRHCFTPRFSWFLSGFSCGLRASLFLPSQAMTNSGVWC